MSAKYSTVLDRLKRLLRIDERTGCWEWAGHRDQWGYGVIKIGGRKGKYKKTHRVMYQESVGEIPVTMLVCHHCDNPPCCNPDHLFLGTDLDNANDRESKGRGGDHKGELNGKAKLTGIQVEEIRKRYAPKRTTRKQLAVEFRVGLGAIKKILSGKNWKFAE